MKYFSLLEELLAYQSGLARLRFNAIQICLLTHSPNLPLITVPKRMGGDLCTTDVLPPLFMQKTTTLAASDKFPLKDVKLFGSLPGTQFCSGLTQFRRKLFLFDIIHNLNLKGTLFPRGFSSLWRFSFN